MVLQACILFTAGAAAQTQGKGSEPNRRIGISGGMGVSYFNATDIVDRVNGTGITTERADDFVAAAEFFGAVTYPLSADWALKLEYAYLITSYNVQTIFPGSEFSVTVHMPMLIAHYILVDKGVYNVKAGAGLGYHYGSYVERYGTAGATFTGSGVGAKLDLEANTAFGESFYAYIGGDLRFDFIGSLKPEDNANAGVGITPGLGFFSIGAKLGFTFYL
ncbi:MAG: hypothetical protein OEV30_07055 [Ignavibacteria bacterium]|nr:hypothetical protein [Ignavibacteria bacterium]